jgi:poly-D-alanine transfer protein DltD
MKHFVLIYLFPFLLAAFIVLTICYTPLFDKLLFDIDTYPKAAENNHISNFKDYAVAYQNHFLDHTANANAIYVLGSSELTTEYVSMPNSFINRHFNANVLSVGSAGNQCFSIYAQLLANEEKLNNAQIVMVISPLWFEANYAKGTNPDKFLEFNTNYFLNKIIRNGESDVFKEYASHRIIGYNKTYQYLPLAFKVFEVEHTASESVLNKMFYSPVVWAYKSILTLNVMALNNAFDSNKNQYEYKTGINQNAVTVNWDSLYTRSKESFLKTITNNTWFVDNVYYRTYVNGKTRVLATVDNHTNQELKDFEMLLRLCKEKNVKASFIIFPMNPYAYTNLSVLNPIVDTITKTIASYTYPCYNTWISDTTNFEKGTLFDIMHASEYAWYKADKFIVDTYNLKILK